MKDTMKLTIRFVIKKIPANTAFTLLVKYNAKKGKIAWLAIINIKSAISRVFNVVDRVKNLFILCPSLAHFINVYYYTLNVYCEQMIIK